MINIKVSTDQLADEWNLFSTFHTRSFFRNNLKRRLPELFNKLIKLEAGRQSDLVYYLSDSMYNRYKVNFNEAVNKLTQEFLSKKKLIHEFCDNYYAKNKPGMEKLITKFNKVWNSKKSLINSEFERLMQTKLPDFNVNITLTIATRCPFEYKTNWFMIDYPSPLINALRTAIHETTHLIYYNHFKVAPAMVGSDWWRIQEVIPDIILSELIKNPKFKNLKKVTRIPAYPENKSLFPIVYSYYKKNGFTKLIEQIKKDPDYFIKLELKAIKR